MIMPTLNLKNDPLKILVTGAAGFIGFHLIKALQVFDHQIVGIDNLNDYYDPQLKLERLKVLGLELGSDSLALNTQARLVCGNLSFIKLDLADRAVIAQLFEQEKFDLVVNLGAQAGVRYSIQNPHA